MSLHDRIPRGTKVLLTGGTGFIGSRLVEVLVREYDADVSILVRNFKNASRVARFDVRLLIGDVNDLVSLSRAAEGAELLFNLAYDFGVKADQKRSVTTAGAQNVARAVLDQGVKRLVHFSTISAYGDTLDGPLTETSTLQPTEDLYGLSKRDADEELMKWARESGLPVSIIAPTIVYGPFSKPWTHGPLAQLASGTVVLPESGEGLCNAVYVDDVVRAALLAATEPKAIGETFLISGETPVTWKEFYGAYEGMLGYQSTLAVSEIELVSLQGGGPPKAAEPTPPPAKQRGLIEALLGKSSPVPDKPTTKPALPTAGKLHLPGPARKILLASKTSVRIEKAKAILGYRAEYDLARGMKLTAEYAAWANLLVPSAETTIAAAAVVRDGAAAVERQRLAVSRDRLVALKDRYADRRCFVIGNGPSLNETDVALLKDEITIGCNGLFLLYDRMGFEPTFYTVEDVLVAEDRADIINNMRGSTKVFPSDLRYCLKPDRDTIYINFRRPGYKGFPKFSGALEDEAFWGGTVTFMNLQLAYHLGCKEIYLVGVDHSYRDKNEADTQEKMTITANTPDPNHFHPDYFGPGYRYHVPNVERMEIGYQKAKEFLADKGVAVYNATTGGKLEVFERRDFDSLFPLGKDRD